MLTLKNQYLAGLLTLAITVLTAAVALPETAWAEAGVVWQFGGMVVGTIVVIFLPLSKGAWAGALKIGGAIAAAIVSNVVAFLLTEAEWGFYQWLLIGLAVLNVIAGELGIQARVTDAKLALASSSHADTVVVQEIDPKAATAAATQLEGAEAKLGH